jgi:RTX calcium-binding nonapeptide repeat (4 copies)
LSRSVSCLLVALFLTVVLAPGVADASLPLPRCTITGTERADVLQGTAGPDVICGLGGNDVIRGGGGNDVIFGGAGNDVIYGGAGNDSVWGGAGNDRIVGGAGDDHLDGGTGNDNLVGGGGNDHLYGDAGNDHLSGGPGDDALWGDLGNDTVSGGGGQDLVSGGPGTNTGPRQPNYPSCPKLGSGPESPVPLCLFRLHLDAKYCNGFGSSQGHFPPCVGAAAYGDPTWGPSLFDLPAMWSQFGWAETGRGTERTIQYATLVAGLPIASLFGRLPASNSARLTVNRAFTLTKPQNLHADDDGRTPAGQPGGPVYMDFQNGYVGADIYFEGYLAPGSG